MEILDFLKNGDELCLPNLSIDVVIMGYEHEELKFLLLRLGERWVLPGGYILKVESVDDAALRILKERTNLERPRLNFLSVFGKEDRNFREQFRQFAQEKGLPWQDDYWINSRFVTLSYYSLVDRAKTFPSPGPHDQEVAWFSFDELPDMWLDHKNIVLEARNRIQKDLKAGRTAHELLPEKFTMPELHQLHQNILGEELDRSRFQKKVLASGRFERLPKLKKGTPGRNPFLYKVIDDETR